MQGIINLLARTFWELLDIEAKRTTMALGVAHENPKTKVFQDAGNIKKIQTLNLILPFNASVPPECHTFKK